MIRRSAGLNFADWILQQHPGFYQFLITKARSRGLSGLGQDLSPAQARDMYFDPNVTASPLDSNTIESTTNPVQALDPTALTPIETTAIDTLWPATAPIQVPDPSASAGSNLIANVFTTSVAGLSSLVGLADQYFKTQQSANNARIQTAVLQTQAARVIGGANPAAISYVRNPVTGQLQPTLMTYTGTVPLSNRGLASLVPPGSSVSQLFSGYGLYILGGAALLLVMALARR